jgi:hypothetical protein
MLAHSHQPLLNGPRQAFAAIVETRLQIVKAIEGHAKTSSLAKIVEALSRIVYMSSEPAFQPRFDGAELLGQVVTVRHDAHRCCRGRLGTNVRDLIGDGQVSLMADPADHRDAGLKDSAGNAFFVECPQVFKAAAAAGQDHQIDSFQSI